MAFCQNQVSSLLTEQIYAGPGVGLRGRANALHVEGP